MSRLRATNAVVAAAMLALFLVHGVGSAFQLFGVGSVVPKVLAWAALALCVAHACIGVALTFHDLRAGRAAVGAHPVLNRRLWTVRASGLAIAVLVALHLVVFLRPAGGAAVRLALFGEMELVSHLLLALAILVHVLASAEPLMISLGIAFARARAADLALVLAALILLMAVAFIVYYLRWSVV